MKLISRIPTFNILAAKVFKSTILFPWQITILINNPLFSSPQ